MDLKPSQNNQLIEIKNVATSIFDESEKSMKLALSNIVEVLDNKLTDHEEKVKVIMLSEIENINTILNQERDFRKLQEQDLIKLAIEINNKEIELNSKIKDLKEDNTLTEKSLDDKILELTTKTRNEQDLLTEQLALETGYSKKEILNRIAQLEQSLISEYFREKDEEFNGIVEGKLEEFQDSKTFKFLSKMGANQERMLEFYKKFQWDKQYNKAIGYIELEKEKYEEFKQQKLRDKLEESINNPDIDVINKNIDNKVNEIYQSKVEELKPQILRVMQHDNQNMLIKYENIKKEYEETKLLISNNDTKLLALNDEHIKTAEVVETSMGDINALSKQQKENITIINNNVTKISEVNNQQIALEKTVLREKKENKKFRQKTNKKIMTLRKRVIVQYLAGFAVVSLVAMALDTINNLITSAIRPLFMLTDSFGVGDFIRSKASPELLESLGVNSARLADQKNFETVKDNMGDFNADKYMNKKDNEKKLPHMVASFEESWNKLANNPKSKVAGLIRGDKNVDIKDASQIIIKDMNQRKKGTVETDFIGLSDDEKFILNLTHGRLQMVRNNKVKNSANVTNVKQNQVAKKVMNDKQAIDNKQKAQSNLSSPSHNINGAIPINPTSTNYSQSINNNDNTKVGNGRHMANKASVTTDAMS